MISLSSQEVSYYMISVFLCGCFWHFDNVKGIMHTALPRMNLAMEISKCSAFYSQSAVPMLMDCPIIDSYLLMFL